MFVGRLYELAQLDQIYKSKQFEFLVLYGRRRIGKTTLLQEFSKDKNVLFYAAQESNDSLNLKQFSKAIYHFFNLPLQMPPFQEWNTLFEFLANQAREKPFTLIIDEFPYLVNQNRSILSILQHTIDYIWKITQSKLIICGSSMSFMEHEVLSEKSPLFGRRTAQMRLEELSIFEIKEYLNTYSEEQLVYVYALMGGTPQYLSLLHQEQSLDENAIRLFYQPNGYLYDEPMYLLRQELREPGLYNAIIRAIALGKTKMNEIAMEVGEPPSKLSQYLANLIELELIEKETPFFDRPEKSKKAIYRIKNAMFRYWYRFVFMDRSMIEMHRGTLVYEESKKELPSFIGYSFEEICKQFLIKENGAKRLPFMFRNIGRWWGKDQAGKADEIDLMASDSSRLMICECKWTNENVSMSIYRRTLEKAKQFTNTYEVYCVLFSKSGFTKDLIEEAKHNDHLYLFSLQDLFQ